MLYKLQSWLKEGSISILYDSQTVSFCYDPKPWNWLLEHMYT